MSTVRDSFHYPAIQIRQLFELIQRKCETSLLNKKRLRMLATAEKLQIYLQAAFDHFAKDLTTPFDLIKEALKHSPVPRGFGGNILTLPLLMQENSATPAHFGTAGTFTDMAPILASCFHLDSVRQNLLGTTERLLNDVYAEFCEYAVKQFSDLYLPCSFENSRGRCCNKRLGHSPKGHQNDLGKQLAPGSYESAFQPHEFQAEWLNLIWKYLQRMEAKFDDQSHTHAHISSADIASSLHRDEINEFYKARATSAALPFFKPYEKPETKDIYLDGALYHNCPVWVAHHEKRLIWPDESGDLPDLLLSVGTGCHREGVRMGETVPSPSIRKAKAGKSPLLSQLYQTGSDRLGDILNCSRIWENFLTENAQLNSRLNPSGTQRHVRINPDLGASVPRLDDVSAIEDVERSVNRYFHQHQDLVKQTAHRLIASTFFFQTEPDLIKVIGSEFHCQGRILCRFMNRSIELKSLGRFLQTCVSGDFEPYFIIQEGGYSYNDVKFPCPRVSYTTCVSREVLNWVPSNFEHTESLLSFASHFVSMIAHILALPMPFSPLAAFHEKW
ncbi:hypothetical protein BGZ61DRAFT_527409 [Ilyonectria robusta]|uniref:uncharacterized protein n=1 Tax=Ilyonectria robusta TaxID=1079257 RepID=UPI001E8EEAAA|nr:uncharacterized protein BGZ61DRAFT_527409 [Ilyonectria robusta]KAH8736463.1 hypothetical protein BGZ61DRAFT_527409 [Ilyonectria robusta]